jgi:hypothetical protein
MIEDALTNIQLRVLALYAEHWNHDPELCYWIQRATRAVWLWC